MSSGSYCAECLQAAASADAKVVEAKPEKKIEVVKADAKADANAKVGFLAKLSEASHCAHLCCFRTECFP